MSKALKLARVVRGRGITSDLGAFRNKIINGDFAVSQRGANFSSGGYTVDRWESYAFSGNSLDIRSFVFANTVDVVPPVPSYVRLSFTGAVAANATLLAQKIEDVRTLSGGRVTLTFYARMGSGSAVIGASLGQRFGTGGSADVYINAPDFALNGDWKKYSVVLNLPSVAGKTLGSGHNLRLTFSIKSASANAQINMTAVSVVEGDATEEDNPFSPRSIGQELALCQRYYVDLSINSGTVAPIGVGAASAATSARFYVPTPVTMRAVPALITLASGSPLEFVANGANYQVVAPVSMYVSRVRASGVDVVVDGTGFPTRQAAMLWQTGIKFAFDAEL